MTPKLSIITVTRNLIDEGRREAFLAGMAQVQTQSCREIEHVILDGASTDGTQDMIAAAPRGDIPVLFHSEPDAGLYDAMNKAVARARGDMVIFLNSDDGLASDEVAAQLVAARAAGGAAFVYGTTMQTQPDGSVRHFARPNLRATLQRMPFCHNSVAISRDLFLSLGGHDLRYRVASDYDLVLRMVLAGHPGAAVEAPISVFASRGVSGNAMATAEDYARIWLDLYAAYLGRAVSLDEAVNWYRIGQLPMSLCRAIMADRTLPPLVYQAARHSFGISLRRSLQPWRSWDNIGA